AVHGPPSWLLVVAADPWGVGIGGPAGDRVALVVVGVVDLLAVDLDAAVREATQPGRPEVALRALLVAVVALAAAERLVLAIVVGPVLEVLRWVLLDLLEALAVGLLGLGHRNRASSLGGRGGATRASVIGHVPVVGHDRPALAAVPERQAALERPRVPAG